MYASILDQKPCYSTDLSLQQRPITSYWFQFDHEQPPSLSLNTDTHTHTLANLKRNFMLILFINTYYANEMILNLYIN